MSIVITLRISEIERGAYNLAFKRDGYKNRSDWIRGTLNRRLGDLSLSQPVPPAPVVPPIAKPDEPPPQLAPDCKHVALGVYCNRCGETRR